MSFNTSRLSVKQMFSLRRLSLHYGFKMPTNSLCDRKKYCYVALHPDKIRCYTITHVSSSLAYFALVSQVFSFQLTWLPVVRFFWPLSFFKWHWFWQSRTIPFTMNFFPLIEICGMIISTDEKVFLTISCYFSEAFVTYL